MNAAAAGTWLLGDREVNRVGLGAMRLPGDMSPGSAGALIDRDRAIGVLRRAVDLGVNHIDTASFYFTPLCSANELINSALGPYPDDLTIVTKVGPWRVASGQWQGMAAPDQLRGQVEENLRQLGRDHLDVVNLRRIGLESIAEHFGVLADLRTEGLIRHLGVSNVQPRHLAEAMAIAPVVCLQNRYSIETRTAAAESLLETCRRHGIAFVPFFAISGDSREGSAAARAEHAEVLEVARELGATAAQVRLAWTLHRGPQLLAIPGTADPRHLAENIAAGALRLPPEQIAALDRIAGSRV